MSVEILYLAWNRREFTEASFRLLRENTHWALVDRLVIYDQQSTDGTAEFLNDAGKDVGVPAFEFRQHSFGAPAAVMNDYLATSEVDWLVKIDSDIAVPKLWLESMLSVAERHPEIELLGMDGGRHGVADPWQPPEACGYEPASHIGGVGLMRVESFHRRPPIKARGRFGFTEWQDTHQPVRGWITPGLAVAQLDLVPDDPWMALAAEYVRKGWARQWSPYCVSAPWWDWIAPQLEREQVA